MKRLCKMIPPAMPTGLFLLVVVTLTATGCGGSGEYENSPATVRQHSRVAVQTAPVRRDRIEARLSLSGTLLPVRASTIGPEVDGTIIEFPASERAVEYMEDGIPRAEFLTLDLGHQVKEGDVLVRLDPTDYQLALRRAEAGLALATKKREELLSWKRPEEIRALRAELARAEAARENARAELDRAERLIDKKAIAQSDYEAKSMGVRVAIAAVDAAQAALDLAEAGPTPEQIAVAEAEVEAAKVEVARAEDDLRRTVIRAPYDAIIVDRLVGKGTPVSSQPRDDIMRIADCRALFAEVHVPEQHQHQIALYQVGADGSTAGVAWVEAEGLDKKLPGRIDLINGMIDPASRTFRVRVTVDNRKYLLKPGGFVEVEIPIVSRPDAIVVPKDAVTISEGYHVAFVYENGQVARRTLSVGISSEDAWEVRDGLSEGEHVVVSKLALLADGLEVDLVDSGSKTEVASSASDGRDDLAR